MTAPRHVYAIVIRTTPKPWQAITDGDKTVQYFYRTRVRSDWRPGAPLPTCMRTAAWPPKARSWRSSRRAAWP